MIKLNPSAFYLLLEIGGLLFVVAVASIGHFLWRRKQRQNVLLKLVARLKADGSARIEAIAANLKTAGVDDDDDRNTRAQQILNAETNLYRFLIQGLMSEDSKSLIELDQQVNALIDELAMALPSSTASVQTTTAGEQPQFASALKKEMSGLKAEIQGTRTELLAALAKIGTAAPIPSATPVQAPLETSDPASAEPQIDIEPATTSATNESSDLEELDFSLADDASQSDQDVIDLSDVETTDATADDAPALDDDKDESEPVVDDAAIAEIPDDLLFSQGTPEEEAVAAPVDEKVAPDESAETTDAGEITAGDEIKATEQLDEPPAATDATELTQPSADDSDVTASEDDESAAPELSLTDPDDILDQLEAQESKPESAKNDAPKSTKSEPELSLSDDNSAPPKASESSAAVSAEEPPEPTSSGPSKALDDIDPDDLLDSLLGESNANPHSGKDDAAAGLLLSSDEDIEAETAKTAENKKSNDIVSEKKADAPEKVSAEKQPLIPDDDAPSEKSSQKVADKSKPKVDDKEALIAELEDLLG